jgi:hypothetical protein
MLIFATVAKFFWKARHPVWGRCAFLGVNIRHNSECFDGFCNRCKIKSTLTGRQNAKNF